MRRVIGIDPGKTGAMAAIDGHQLVAVVDMPTVPVMRSKKLRKKLSCALLLEAIIELKSQLGGHVDLAVLEDVWGRPRESGMYEFGVCNGAVEMGLVALGIRLEFISPANWKRQFKLSSDKSLSRNMAIQLWPDQAGLFARVKDDGRAEAALLAEYGRVNYT